MDRLERQQSETQERLIQHDISRQEGVESSANGQTQTWSCGKIALVVAMLVYAVNIGALMSLQAPFYPMEATKKGATPSEASKG